MMGGVCGRRSHPGGVQAMTQAVDARGAGLTGGGGWKKERKEEERIAITSPLRVAIVGSVGANVAAVIVGRDWVLLLFGCWLLFFVAVLLLCGWRPFGGTSALMPRLWDRGRGVH